MELNNNARNSLVLVISRLFSCVLISFSDCEIKFTIPDLHKLSPRVCSMDDGWGFSQTNWTGVIALGVNCKACITND